MSNEKRISLGPTIKQQDAAMSRLLKRLNKNKRAMTTKPTPQSDAACLNTDKELWREREGDYYADSLFVTAEGGIGINCGGHVIVRTLKEWHKLATPAAPKADPAKMRSAKYWYVQEVWAGRSPQQYLDVISAIQQDAIASVTLAPAADAGLAKEICRIADRNEPSIEAYLYFVDLARKALSAAPQEQSTRRTAEELCHKIINLKGHNHDWFINNIDGLVQSALDDEYQRGKADAERAAAVPDLPDNRRIADKAVDMFGMIDTEQLSRTVKAIKALWAASPQPPVGEG